jgi:hypothetical protein
MHNEILGLYDIYTVHHVPVWQQSWYLYTIAGSICSIVWLFSLLIAFIFYQKAKKIVYIDTWSYCMQTLESLCPKETMTETEQALFYDKITVVLKQHLAAHYGAALYDATDYALYMHYKDAQDELLSSIAPVFQRSIEAKFARRYVPYAHVHHDYEVVRHLILSTKSSKQA